MWKKDIRVFKIDSLQSTWFYTLYIFDGQWCRHTENQIEIN